MSHVLIIAKSDSRLVFVSNATIPIMLDALWPVAAYTYILYHESLASVVVKRPWEHVVKEGKIIPVPCATALESELNYYKAFLLSRLVKAINRHRQGIVKSHVLGQDKIYALKVDEAERFIANPQQDTIYFPWLSGSAAFEGLTLLQSANQIMFRHTQSVEVLRNSENQRRWFVKRILNAHNAELDTIRSELSYYERII